MLEIILIIGISVMMGRLAGSEGKSGALWGFATFGVCMGSLLIPLPFLRVLISGAAVFVAMIYYSITKSKK